jgi:methyl-accepting chemotaxis protein
MFRKQRQRIVTSIQIKTTLLIAGVMTFLLIAFFVYDVLAQHAALSEAVLRKGDDLAVIGAANISTTMEQALAADQLTEAQLFVTDYTPIPDSNPPQYQAPYDILLRGAIQQAESAFLQGEYRQSILGVFDAYLLNEGASEREILYAMVMDRNGYVPTRKTILAGEVDRRAAEYTQDDRPLQQFYEDEATGAAIWDISFPIRVEGQHWGTFRVGILLDRVWSRTYAAMWRTGLGALGLVIAMSVAAFFLARSVARPIIALRDTAARLAAGDLTGEIEIGQRDDEVEELAVALGQTNATWREIIGGLRDNAVRLSTTAAELASSAEELSRTTTAQSDEMARTSSATEEMAASIQEVAFSAELAAQAADTASERALSGSRLTTDTANVLVEANEVMQRLRAHSDEIGSIVSLIQEVAAQTNILALNAAIEAAGAGVAGARFDVVAEEIRKLAGRTHQATGEIASLVGSVQADIQDAAHAISEATALARDSGDSLADIVASSSSVSEMIRTISTATAEQSRTSGEIANAVDTMVGSSHQTVEATRETAEIGIELSNLAERLKDAANRFKV